MSLLEKIKKTMGELPEKPVFSFVGAGGKTTCVLKLADELAGLGMKVFVTTSTHIQHPFYVGRTGFLDADTKTIKEAGVPGKVVIAGRKLEQEKKIAGLLETQLEEVLESYDAVVIEADGEKRYPFKVPAEHEPVIYQITTHILIVESMQAFNRPLSEVCFRLEKAQEILNQADCREKLLTPEIVTLRKTQYRISEKKEESVKIAKNFILGKVYNARWVLERAARDYSMRLDAELLKKKSAFLGQSMNKIRECEDAGTLLGLEGEAASVYFSAFDELILQQKEDFYFHGRNKRPPLDNVNAMLSFGYSLLAGMCGGALEAVGLDPYVGFFHTDRPGRMSLALDLMEEFRSVMVDRFVLTLINKRIMKPEYFLTKENGAVIMTEEGRKAFLSAWQGKKQEMITHPFLGEKIEWGMVPYAQSMLLARFLRGDLDEYPPFLWK